MPAYPQQGALTSVNPALILEQYLTDRTTRDIAKQFGVTAQALGRHLLHEAPEYWQECQVARAIARKEQAEEDLDSMRDGSYLNSRGEQMCLSANTVSLARERLKAAQWELERTCRRIYGDRVELTGAGGKDLIPEESIASIKARLIELVATVRLRAGGEPETVYQPEDAQIVESDDSSPKR